MQYFQGKKAAFTNMLCLDGSDGGVKEDKSLVWGEIKLLSEINQQERNREEGMRGISEKVIRGGASD